MDRRLVRGLGVAICAAAVFAGCSGGGGGSSTLSVTQTAQPQATATATPPVAAKTGTASFTFLLPFQRTANINRKAMYISPSTQSVTVTLLTVNGSAPGTPVNATINIGAMQPGCTPTGVQVSCDLSVATPLGSDTFSVTTFSGLNATGTSLGATTVLYTLYANAANHVTLTLSGTIASLYLFSPQLFRCSDCSQPKLYAPGQGSTQQALLVPVPLDAFGNQIVNPGTYNTPITFTSNPRPGTPAGGLLFRLNNNPTLAASVTAAGPSDQVFAVAQSVPGSGSYDITANFGGGNSPPLTVQYVGLPTPTPTPSPTPTASPTPRPIVISGSTLIGGNTLSFFVGSAPQTITVTDSAVPSVTYNVNTCSANAPSATFVGIIPSSGPPTPSPSGTLTSGGTLTITPSNSPLVFGTCQLTISDSTSPSLTVYLNLFSVTGTVQ